METERCTMCAGLCFVPKYWLSDYFVTKTCPACGGTGKVRAQQVKPIPTIPAKTGDIVAGVAFMSRYIMEHTEPSNVVLFRSHP